MTGSALKLIALFSMLLDHTIKTGLFSQQTLLNWGMDIPSSYRLMIAIESLGRLAFPIFAFMVAEGMRHTRSRKKYILQMLLFGVISEIPFDLMAGPLYAADASLPWYAYITPFSTLNVFFTLAFSALGIALTEKLMTQEKYARIAWLPAAAFALICQIFSTDYLIFGPLTVYAAYFPKKRSSRLLLMIALMAIIYLAYSSSLFLHFSLLYHGAHFLAACASVGLIALYNGKRGRKLKWLFYIAYPAHLTILALIRMLPGIS